MPKLAEWNAVPRQFEWDGKYLVEQQAEVGRVGAPSRTARIHLIFRDVVVGYLNDFKPVENYHFKVGETMRVWTACNTGSTNIIGRGLAKFDVADINCKKCAYRYDPL